MSRDGLDISGADDDRPNTAIESLRAADKYDDNLGGKKELRNHSHGILRIVKA